MKVSSNHGETGSTLIATMSAILIVSLIGANVLMNCTTRYNSTAKQVKGWKEALYAAEAGGDIGYAACRKFVSDPANLFTAAHGWIEDTSASNPTWTKTIPTFGPDGLLAAQVTVDKFDETADKNPYYRIRAVGTARVLGLRRTGMDNRMNGTTKGDNLLRKIDFKVDHFVATYGFGDALPGAAATTANGKAIQSVPSDAAGNLLAQVSRRIELVAVPVMAFEGAVKAVGSFAGPGSSGVVDSYHSENGPYVFAATNPGHPYYDDSREGNVAVNTPNFNQGNTIYGNVSTNGGNVVSSNQEKITGVIDNTVAFDIPPHQQPVLPAGFAYEAQSSGSTITPPVRYEADDGVTRKTEFWYLWSGNFSGVTINPVFNGSTPIETVVNIIVPGDVSGVTINKGVTAKIHFRGNLIDKARDLVNNNADGFGATTGVVMVNPQRDNNAATNDSYIPSTNTSRAGHLQFYGINPPAGVTQTVHLQSGGDSRFWGVIYAPGADFKLNGNPEVFGAIVCKNFGGNGGTGFHFDKALAGIGKPIDYRVAHYVEDVR